MRLRTATVAREQRSPHLARLVPRPASLVEVGLTGVLVVDDSDTYRLKAAARELEALVLYEQARRLAEVRELLAERYARDGVAVEDAALEAEAERVAAEERADRFLQEQAGRIDQDAELLGLAVQLDDHALGVWRQAAASLVEVCPTSLGHLRGRVEQERRAQLRGQAQGVRIQATLEGQLTSMGLVGWLAYCRRVAELHGRLAMCRHGLERSQAGLGWLAVKLRVIDTTEQAREAWLADARDVLARGWPPLVCWMRAPPSRRPGRRRPKQCCTSGRSTAGSRRSAQESAGSTSAGREADRRESEEGAGPPLLLARLLPTGHGAGPLCAA